MDLPPFTVEPYNRFAAGVRSIAGFEIRPQNTVTFMHAVDMSRVEAIRRDAAAAGGPEPSHMAVVVKAVALALGEFPYANRRLWGWPGLPFFQTRLQRFHHRDIAVVEERALPGVEVALFSDVLRDADRLSLDEISKRLAFLSRADAGANEPWRRFSNLLERYPRWLSTLLIRLPVFFPSLWVKHRGAAAMVSAPIRGGVDAVAATWTSPLGFTFGSVEERPAVRDGKVVPCPTAVLTLNFDRRVMAGAQAARFFKGVIDLVESAPQHLLAGAGPAPREEAPYTVEPFSRYVSAHRKIVESEMRPKYTVSFLHEVDLTGVEALRARAAAAGGTKPSYTAFVAKAVARALRDFPYANARLCGWPGVPFFRTRLQRFHACDVAVAVERNLEGIDVATFVDVLRDVERFPLASITDWLHALSTGDAAKIRQWREFSTLLTRFPVWLSTRIVSLPLRFPAMWLKYRGGAVLISSPAKYGVDSVTGSWPWALGVSFGVVKLRPAVRDGEIVARRSFTLTLNFDRGFMAVAPAARFFRRLVEVLENAETSLAEPPAEAVAAPDPGSARRANRPRRGAAPRYTIEPNSRWISAYRFMADTEMEPHRTVVFTHDVDLTEIESLRDEARRSGGVPPSYVAFVAKASAIALSSFPQANRRLWARSWIPFRSPRLLRFHRCDVAVAVERNVPGVAVATSVEILRNAETLSLAEVMGRLRAAAVDDPAVNARWRLFSSLVTRLPYLLSTLALRLPVLSPTLWVKHRGGAIFVNAPGDYGVDILTGEWSWPLAVAFGTAALRPVVRTGAVVVRPTFRLTLMWDRRVMTGAAAAAFFRQLMDALEHARTELAEGSVGREVGESRGAA